MKSSPDFPLRITEVRGTQGTMARGGVYPIEGNVHAPLSAKPIFTQPNGTVAEPVAVQAGTGDFAVVVKLNGSGPLHVSCRSHEGATYGAIHVDSALPAWWARMPGGHGVYYDRCQLEKTAKVAEIHLQASNWDELDHTGASDSAELAAASIPPICTTYSAVNTCAVTARSTKK